MNEALIIFGGLALIACALWSVAYNLGDIRDELRKLNEDKEDTQ